MRRDRPQETRTSVVKSATGENPASAGPWRAAVHELYRALDGHLRTRNEEQQSGMPDVGRCRNATVNSTRTVPVTSRRRWIAANDYTKRRAPRSVPCIRIWEPDASCLRQSANLTSRTSPSWNKWVISSLSPRDARVRQRVFYPPG